MHSRRTALRFVGSTAALGAVSGCLGGFSLTGGSIDVHIENRDDRSGTVDVTFEEGGETAFEDRFTVAAGEETTVSDAVEAGEYQVTVERGSTDTETVDFQMNGCTSNSLFVGIQTDGALEAGVSDEC